MFYFLPASRRESRRCDWLKVFVYTFLPAAGTGCRYLKPVSLYPALVIHEVAALCKGLG